jgi:hypothetical protein
MPLGEANSRVVGADQKSQLKTMQPIVEVGSISAIAAASSSVKSSAILFSADKYTTTGGIVSTEA